MPTTRLAAKLKREEDRALERATTRALHPPFQAIVSLTLFCRGIGILLKSDPIHSEHAIEAVLGHMPRERDHARTLKPGEGMEFAKTSNRMLVRIDNVSGNKAPRLKQPEYIAPAPIIKPSESPEFEAALARSIASVKEEAVSSKPPERAKVKRLSNKPITDKEWEEARAGRPKPISYEEAVELAAKQGKR